ncbi:hypothetical protein [Vibrio crassostreae]|uniref:hypothetical protein n=1 Tax=Vibrio crassostreae TaxID=246167 RepID=UPI001B308DF1|nr:hypothetical protein [Vibrio crassostreae]
MDKKIDNLLGWLYYIALAIMMIGIPLLCIRTGFEGAFVTLLLFVAVNAVIVFDLREFRHLSRKEWLQVENPFIASAFDGGVIQALSYASIAISIVGAVIVP